MARLRRLLELRTSSRQRQLELELNDSRLNVLWEGRSPRELTRVRMGLFLSQEAQKSVSEFVDPA